MTLTLAVIVSVLVIATLFSMHSALCAGKELQREIKRVTEGRNHEDRRVRGS